MSLSKGDKVRNYTMMLRGVELLTIKQFLVDLKDVKDLVDSNLSGDNNSGRHGIGINDRVTGDISISNVRDKTAMLHILTPHMIINNIVLHIDIYRSIVGIGACRERVEHLFLFKESP